MLTKVISGGQYGSDIAGVRAAKRAGLATGGALPKGFRTDNGPRPGYAKEFGMIELDTDDYPTRTRKNVEDSDATILIVYDPDSRGSRTTLLAVRELRKKARTIELPDDFLYRELSHPHRRRLPESEYAEGDAFVEKLVAWIIEQRFTVVNIAGNRDAHLETPVESLLFEVFRRVKEAQSNDSSQ